MFSKIHSGFFLYNKLFFWILLKICSYCMEAYYIHTKKQVIFILIFFMNHKKCSSFFPCFSF